MHRPLGRNLGIHNLFSTKIAIRGFSLATQFVGSWLSGCLLTTPLCILPVKGRRGCNRTREESARRVRWSVSSWTFPGDFDFGMSLSGERIVVEILFPVTLPAITKSQPHAQSHHSKGRSHQDCDSFTDGLLPIFGSCRGRAIAHGAALREGGDRP
jgi:hypothetical protein